MSGQNCGPCRARFLRGRPAQWRALQPLRHAGRAPVPLCHACAGQQYGPRQCRRGTGAPGRSLATGSDGVPDLGKPSRDGIPPSLNPNLASGNRCWSLFLRPANSLSVRQQRDHQRPLRQYLRRGGMGLSGLPRDDPCPVALSLKTQPRKIPGYRTPADTTGGAVALTGGTRRRRNRAPIAITPAISSRFGDVWQAGPPDPGCEGNPSFGDQAPETRHGRLARCAPDIGEGLTGLPPLPKHDSLFDPYSPTHWPRHRSTAPEHQKTRNLALTGRTHLGFRRTILLLRDPRQITFAPADRICLLPEIPSKASENPAALQRSEIFGRRSARAPEPAAFYRRGDPGPDTRLFAGED